MNKSGFIAELEKQRRERGPIHYFPDLGSSERLSYEKLTETNVSKYVEMFTNDKSAFIDNRFKTLKTAKQYSYEVLNSIFSPKCGACDFLIKLKATETYIGILHLFDYSIEDFSDMLQRCTVGFAISEPFRRKYYATEAINNLMDYAKLNHNKTKFLAYTNSENKPANDFLQSIGMELKNEEYYYGGNGKNYWVMKKR